MLYLAIDQHRKQLTNNLRNEEGQVLLRRQVSTQWDKVRAFFEKLQTDAQEQGGYVAILEVCGFNDWLLDMLQEYGCREIVLIQPKETSNKKSDRRDANQLGEILWVNRGRLLSGERVQGIRRVRIVAAGEQENRRLTMRRIRTTRQVTRTINRIKQILRRHNLEQHQPTKGIDTKAALKWLQTLPLSDLDRLMMDQLLAEWKLLETQLEALDKIIAERILNSPAAILLGSLTNRAGLSALSLACRIGPIDDFPTPRSLANYFGLTPSCHNSGEATQRLGSITKEGSPVVRYILGQLVLHLLKRDRKLRQWHRRIKLRRGSKIARVAVMRRLTVIIWHMLKRNEPYQIGGRVERGETASSDSVS
jgi:transposase